ncbi:MAG: phosphatase PAP2 family protein [Candidatus Solibacter sp.]
MVTPAWGESTRLDFDVQQKAAKNLDGVVFAGSGMTHRNLFQIEDGPEDFGAEFDKYDGKASFNLLQTIKSVSAKGQDRKVGWGVVQLKQLFQRPRLYQTSLLLGNRTFEWQEAASSLTPAMPSGHALQGMLWVGAAVEQLLNAGEPITDPLRQYLVDPGDRRVMAGVHYPSDNLASWLMIFLSIPFVFRNQGVKEEFWRAVQLSKVYQLMVAAGGEYGPALNALQAAYSGELVVESALIAKTE